MSAVYRDIKDKRKDGGSIGWASNIQNEKCADSIYNYTDIIL